MFKGIMAMIAFIGLSAVCAGCATSGNGEKEDAAIQANRQIVQDLSKVPQQDLHGVSSEPISGKDITPDRR
jgi:hypothetical protein